MDAHKIKILERYGYLKHEMMMSYQGNPNLENLKLEMAKVTLDMELNDLTKQDYIDFKNQKNKQLQNKISQHNDKNSNQALLRSLLFFSAGVLLILLGVGLTEGTNGGMVFYGFILSGCVFIILGGLKVYEYKVLK